MLHINNCKLQCCSKYLFFSIYLFVHAFVCTAVCEINSNRGNWFNWSVDEIAYWHNSPHLPTAVVFFPHFFVSFIALAMHLCLYFIYYITVMAFFFSLSHARSFFVCVLFVSIRYSFHSYGTIGIFQAFFIIGLILLNYYFI